MGRWSATRCRHGRTSQCCPRASGCSIWYWQANAQQLRSARQCGRLCNRALDDQGVGIEGDRAQREHPMCNARLWPRLAPLTSCRPRRLMQPNGSGRWSNTARGPTNREQCACQWVQHAVPHTVCVLLAPPLFHDARACDFCFCKILQQNAKHLSLFAFGSLAPDGAWTCAKKWGNTHKVCGQERRMNLQGA